eukprot:12885986-Alexandrium_andersonii.AAC.1
MRARISCSVAGVAVAAGAAPKAAPSRAGGQPPSGWTQGSCSSRGSRMRTRLTCARCRPAALAWQSVGGPEQKCRIPLTLPWCGGGNCASSSAATRGSEAPREAASKYKPEALR